MKQIHLKSSLFYKFLTSYFIVLTIPIIFIGLFVFNYFSNILEEDIINSNQDMLMQVKNVVDMRLNEIKKISTQISSNSELTPYNIKKNAYRAAKAMQELRKFFDANEFIYDISLYIHNDEYIYSPFTTYTPSRFFKLSYNYKFWNENDFIKTINCSSLPLIRPAEDVNVKRWNSVNITTDRLITYFVPIPIYNNNPYATAIFQIQEQTFIKLIQDILKDYNGNTIIFDDKNQIICSLKNMDYLDNNEFFNIIENTDNYVSKNIVLDNKEYLLSYINSEQSNWSYVTLIPTCEIMEKVLNVKHKTLIGFSMVLIISSFVIFYITNINYNPIKELKTYTEKKWGKSIVHTNEIDAIRLAVDELYVKNENLSAKIENSQTALRDFLLFKLLKGQILDINKFNETGKDVNLIFTKLYFMVSIFYIHNIQSLSQTPIEYIGDSIERHLPDCLEGYYKNSMDNHSLIFIFSTDYNKSQFIKNQIELLRSSIEKEWNVQTTAAIGNSYINPCDIGKSYLEASTAFDYRLIHGNNKTILFSNISRHDGKLDSYPNNTLNKLHLTIKQGNAEIISNTVIEIINFIHENSMPLFMVRCLCYDIINTVIKAMYEMGMEHFVKSSEYPDVTSLLEFETVEDLEKMVMKLSFNICDYIQQNDNYNQMNLTEKMLCYMHKDFQNPAFSVQMMADFLCMSPSYLSRYFKEQTNQTITDYVNNLRIEKAKQLLETSDKTLQNITNEIGYYDVSSFIRKFKKEISITPGKYRQIKAVGKR